MSDIVPAWMWGDPGKIIERLIADDDWRVDRAEQRMAEAATPREERDRYYTMARRTTIKLHVKQLEAGKR